MESHKNFIKLYYLTNNGKFDLNNKSIVTNCEIALMNSIKRHFPKPQRIKYYFHYM